MANTLQSPNMLLPVPVAGQDPGPQYATDVNGCLAIIDQHNHTSGSGVQIPAAGLNIQSELTLNNNLLSHIQGLALISQSSTPSSNTLYENSVDLYFVDGNGNNVRLTQSGAVAGTPGSIANLASPASASYSTSSGTFVFQSAANTPGNIDGGSFILRNNAANSRGLTLSPPAAMAADYAITFPNLPGALSFATLDSSGNFGTISASGGITSSNIAAATIVSSNIAAQGVARSNLPAVGSFSSAPTTFTVTAGSMVAIPNFITSMAFTGRPAIVGVSPAAGVANTGWELVGAAGATFALIGLFIDNVQYAETRLGNNLGSGAITCDYPSGSVNFFIPAASLPASTHQIDIRMLLSNGSSVSITNSFMYIYELMGS